MTGPRTVVADEEDASGDADDEPTSIVTAVVQGGLLFFSIWKWNENDSDWFKFRPIKIKTEICH